jgi:hypothetical protein
MKTMKEYFDSVQNNPEQFNPDQLIEALVDEIVQLSKEVQNSEGYPPSLEDPELDLLLIQCSLNHEHSMSAAENFGIQSGTSLPAKYKEILCIPLCILFERYIKNKQEE